MQLGDRLVGKWEILDLEGASKVTFSTPELWFSGLFPQQPIERDIKSSHTISHFTENTYFQLFLPLDKVCSKVSLDMCENEGS